MMGEIQKHARYLLAPPGRGLTSFLSILTSFLTRIESMEYFMAGKLKGAASFVSNLAFDAESGLVRCEGILSSLLEGVR